jgi:hypothetical protein
MLNLIMKILGLWGLADACWMAARPSAWSNFWQQTVAKVGHGQVAPRVLALLQIATCLWMLQKTSRGS